MGYTQFVGAEEIQHNIDTQCGEKTNPKLSSDLLNYKLQFLEWHKISWVLVHILVYMFLYWR